MFQYSSSSVTDFSCSVNSYENLIRFWISYKNQENETQWASMKNKENIPENFYYK